MRAIVLLELIISIFILSIISIYSLKFTNTLYMLNSKNTDLNYLKLDFESTQLYLEENGLNDIVYNNISKKLYYNNQLLLDNITSYNINYIGSTNTIDICCKQKYELCQKWVFYK